MPADRNPLLVLKPCPHCETGCLFTEEDPPGYPVLICVNCGHRIYARVRDAELPEQERAETGDKNAIAAFRKPTIAKWDRRRQKQAT